MALTNADLRRMINEGRNGVDRSLPSLTLPDRFPSRAAPVSRPPLRHDVREVRRQDGRDDVVRTVEIVWAPAPAARPGSRVLGGLATVAKVLALPVLLVGSLYAQPVYECQKQKSLGMLYHGTTVQMCVNDRMAERVEGAHAFVDRQMRGM